MSSHFPQPTDCIVEVDTESARELQAILHRLVCTCSPQTDFESFMREAASFIKALPSYLIADMLSFRAFGNDTGVIVIRGLPIDDSMVGVTPPHWEKVPHYKSNFSTELMLTAIGSLLGDIFAFESQYGGSIIQNLMPVYEHADDQLGTGSQVFLDWHTEDAFDDYRADFIGLLCLRSNPDAATTFAPIRHMSIPHSYRKQLFEQAFVVGVDQAHSSLADSATRVVSVLFGDYEDPCLRLDPMYMAALEHVPGAGSALDYIVSQIPAAAKQVVLQQGDLLFMDNHRVVHGRTAFAPKFDGTDRWLQRISIARDLSKSQPRRNARSRLIAPLTTVPEETGNG